MLENSLLQTLTKLHDQGKKITLVTGVFDLLHQEHTLFLEKASELADVLIVGLESDVRVRQLKGEGRPIENQQLRKSHLEELGIADLVFILPEGFSNQAAYDQLIAEIRPTYLAVSSHSPYQENKQALMEKYGGELKVVHEFNPAISTTILEKNLPRKS